MKYGESGITLIEVIITIAVVGILIGAVYSAYFSAYNVFSFNQEKTSFHRDQRLIKENMGKHVRRAESIIDNFEGNNLKINYDSEFIVYKRNNNDKLYYEDNSGDQQIVSQAKVEAFDTETFSYNSNDQILKVKLTLIQGDKNYTFVERFYSRMAED